MRGVEANSAEAYVSKMAAEPGVQISDVPKNVSFRRKYTSQLKYSVELEISLVI